MWKNITKSLEIGDIISFVGGGGKTTLMFRIARALADSGYKVLVTTTTKIYDVDDHMYEKYVLRETISTVKHGKTTGITVFGDKIENSKLIGASPEALRDYIDFEGFDFVLIEADGSKKKSIKAYKNHEPVVPKYCNKVIAVISMDIIGCSLTDSYVYNPEALSQILDKSIGSDLNASDIAKLVVSEKGLFQKNDDKKKIVFLTKCYNKEKNRIAHSIIKDIKDKDEDITVYTSY